MFQDQWFWPSSQWLSGFHVFTSQASTHTLPWPIWIFVALHGSFRSSLSSSTGSYNRRLTFAFRDLSFFCLIHSLNFVYSLHCLAVWLLWIKRIPLRRGEATSCLRLEAHLFFLGFQEAMVLIPFESIQVFCFHLASIYYRQCLALLKSLTSKRRILANRMTKKLLFSLMVQYCQFLYLEVLLTRCLWQ